MSFSSLLYIVPSSAITVVTSAQGSAVGGSPYSLTCTVTRPSALLATPDITWVRPGGSEFTGPANVSEVGSLTVVSVTLEFGRLLVSSGGLYTCEVSLVSSDLLDFNFNSTATLTTQCKLGT